MQHNMDEKYDGITTFKIGEAARRAGVNKETIRYYERRNLIPEPDRRRSGYRILTQRHVDQIKFIKQPRISGLPSPKSKNCWPCVWMAVLPANPYVKKQNQNSKMLLRKLKIWTVWRMFWANLLKSAKPTESRMIVLSWMPLKEIVMTNIKRQSTISCPECGNESKESMATDSCQYFWECSHCHELIKAAKNDCCVFCSYGNIPCPPVQKSQSCC